MSFEDDDGRESQKQYYLPTVKIKDYVMIDERKFFDQPVKKDLKTLIILEKLAQVTVMITQQDVYYIIPISKIL